MFIAAVCVIFLIKQSACFSNPSLAYTPKLPPYPRLAIFHEEPLPIS